MSALGKVDQEERRNVEALLWALKSLLRENG